MDNTWRYPGFGFWTVHVASLALLGYLGYKNFHGHCEDNQHNNDAFPSQMPKRQEPEHNQI